MGNSLPEIKEKANYVTASNDEDGVAKVLGFIIKVNEKRDANLKLTSLFVG